MWHSEIILVFILSVALLSALFLFCYQCFNQRHVSTISQICILIVFLTSIFSPLLLPFSSHAVWKIPILLNLDLPIVLQYDGLTWVMLCLVSFVSLIIHSYAARYLLSDSNQTRFMGQLSLLTFSVILLMMSGSLLSAFIAWQFIGFSLYLLLNHYHYDLKANKSAKKKFMINRVGDLCFLTAVLLALSEYGTTDYLTLFHHAGGNNTAILSLIFIAVMTKSAQFPFHIWLVDTMEAPTPVSALMHAGVINAGGFLLARLSPLYVEESGLLLFIFVTGFATALVGNFFMCNQSDIKKQLAYSTMGQMGYMVMQCGLGCFSSAVFHLVSHGFFKATSFLSFGNTLRSSNHTKAAQAQVSQKFIRWSICLFLTFIFVSLGIYYLSWTHYAVQLNPLLWFFISISVFQFLNKSFSGKLSTVEKFASALVAAIIFFIYLNLLKHFNFLLINGISEIQIDLIGWIALTMVSLVTLISLAIYYRAPRKSMRPLFSKLYAVGLFKLNLEGIYRRFFINPLRKLGDIFLKNYDALPKVKKRVFLLILLIWFAATLLIHFSSTYNQSALADSIFVLINLFLLVILLLISNRVFKLSYLAVTLMLVILCMSTLPLVFQESDLSAIGIFQLINGLVVMLGFYLLLKRPNQKFKQQVSYNRLPWEHFYLSVFLIMLIGIPGTASFISEFYLLMGLLHFNFLYAACFAMAMLLLALTVLHSLQEHFFNPLAKSQCAAPVSRLMHCFCMLVVAFNLFNGLHPVFLLQSLSMKVGV